MPRHATRHRATPLAARLLPLPIALLMALLVPAWPATATAQYLTRPERSWRSLATRHFDVYFPAEMDPWARDVASRLDAVHAGVGALVGYAPGQRITVLVEDPLNVANGFALPFRDQPTIFLWPTPPDPTSLIANHRGWGELLAVHEYAHIAHLTRPSRNARQRLLWRLLPVDVGPIARRAPRWVTEGYATVIEGQLTGSGRPSSAGRAAVLRARALEGQLPTYAQLDASGTYQGGAMAYLAGSAFLEWLQAARGDSSLVHLWRRMTARQDRGFAAAFTGVFGAPPDELYGRFAAELTGQALEAEQRLQREGTHAGALVQRRQWSTGDPAVSPDGALLALTLHSRDRPARVVIWRSSDSAETAVALEGRERMMERDPEDVPAVRERPLPKAAVATLHAVNGAAYTYPRFLPDGRQLLVSRSVPVGDGTVRPDLFIWSRESGHVRRVTHGAGIRWADPSPDGRAAAAVRCDAGSCDLVRVDLANGRVTVLAAGSPSVSWFRPRWSPSGHAIAASVQRDGRWQLAVLPADGGPARVLAGAQEASRYGADWTPDGRALVATSERGGVPHLARVDLHTGDERPLTRTTGASLAPDVGHDGSAYFLELHSRGLDVRQVHADSVLAAAPPSLLANLTPAVAPLAPQPADTLGVAALPPSRPYGWGPRRWRVLPGASASPEGWSASLMAANMDPIARFTWLAQGGIGEPGAWRGGAISAAWRGLVPTISAEAFWTEQRPSTVRDGAVVPPSLDAVYAGGHAFADVSRAHARTSWRAAGGASAGAVDVEGDAERVGRVLGYGELSAGIRLSSDRWSVGGSLAPQLAVGRTGAASWTRPRIASRADVRVGDVRVAASGTYAEVGRDAPAYEQLAVGGLIPPFFDERLLSQRLAMPVLPPGTLGGRRAGTVRLALPVLGAEAYYWLGSAGERLEHWHRVVGAEYDGRFPAIGFVRLPQTVVRVGAGYSLDEPFRRRVRGYAAVVYRP